MRTIRTTRTHLDLPACWAGLLLLGLTGCDEPADDDDSSPADDQTPTPVPATPTPTATPAPLERNFRITGSTPARGAMAVPQGSPFTLYFNEPLTAAPTVLEARVRGPDDSVTPLTVLELSRDGKTLSFLPFGLSLDTDYTLEVNFPESVDQEIPPQTWPHTYEASFTTRIPCGVSFNIATEVLIVQLGGNEAIVGVLNDALEKAGGLSPVALMFVDLFTNAAFPAYDLTVASGLTYDTDKNGRYEVDPEYGFPVSMTGCRIDAGGLFTCGPQDFIFPIPVTSTTVINLYITGAEVAGVMRRAGESGNMDSSPPISDLANFSLEGVITEEDIERIAAETGLQRAIDQLLILDVDLDGDGVLDAATAKATSQPSMIAFEGCEASGL